ncbi:MAG: ABC transporter ATP-binding protein [Candidatus Thorarchaeota archaeon]
MVSVELHGLMRRFRDGTSIGPIDLAVNDGELMTLLGPSGSGKTTTLRMVAGFFRPQAGRLLFDGQDVTFAPPRDRNIGMVFQSVALFPNMNVYQNIAFALEMAGWSRETTIDRVEYLADLLGIQGLLMRRSNEVSGGEGQRIALARALAKEPNLLLLDEPLSALDPQLRERLQTEIRRIQDELDITTIYVTHSQDEAFAISDRVAILNEGVVNQVGQPEELYDKPANEFVAGFLGSGNVLTGLVVNLTLDVSKDSPQASVISVVPKIGTFRITLDFHGQTIVASVPDESLAHKLRSMKDAEVGFKFTDGSVMLLE